MDPDRCLSQFRAAVHLGDLDDAMNLGSALTTWIRSGGFLPAGCRTPGAALTEVRIGLAQICNLRGVLRPLAHAVIR